MVSYTEDRTHPGGREFLHAQQPADLIEPGREIHLCVGVYAAGDSPRLRHGHEEGLVVKLRPGADA